MAPLLEFMLACVPDMVWQVDAEGCLCYANAQWREFAGERAREDWADLVHPGDLPAWSQRAAVGSPRAFECRLRRVSENNYSWYKVQSYLEENGSQVTIITNIQNEKLLEMEIAELRSREEIYSQLVSNSCDPVITFDAERGTVVSINRAAERAFQYPAAEILGRSINALLPNSYSAHGPKGMLATCMRSAVHGRFVTVGGSEPVYASRRDGHRIPITLSVADFVISSTQLYVAILGMTKDEIIKQEELRNSKDSFLRTMSHELRTPLFGLLGTLSTILEDSHHSLSATSSPQQSELLPNELAHSVTFVNTTARPHSPFQNVLYDNFRSLRREDTNGMLAELGVRTESMLQLEEREPPARETPRSAYRRKNNAELRQMESCTRSLLSVVNNMITYYKIDMAVDPISMPVQLRTLLKEVCGYFEGCVDEDVVFTQEVKDLVPQIVVSDANLLRHVLANLVSNALRFTNKGSVTVVIDVVEPAPSPDKVNLWISIADTGIGIAPEFFSQVFQPFTQMDSSNTRKYGGAGLGLAVCKRIIDLMGGKISFNSCLGLGTVFEISLPVSIRSHERSESTDTTSQYELDHADEESEGYESDPALFSPVHEHDRRTRRFHSALAPIMENESETSGSDVSPQVAPKYHTAIESYHARRITRTPTPDPLEDYSISTLPPSPVHSTTPTRKSPASAPASPRHQAISHFSPIPSSSRFLRRPSFPFTLDDPSLGLMMGTPSPTPLSCSSSVFGSPTSSPRAAQSPVATPNTNNNNFVFPLHMRVLVVDDNLVNQNVLKKMLKHMECIVTAAQDGQESLNILFDETCPKYVGYNNFDLILMDCQMPVMDGYAATRCIRGWEAERKCKSPIKILSLSASGSSETEKQCYEAGSDGFIAKPVTLQGLFNVLSDRSLVPPQH
eukprot:Phypoly_transcript_02068.p1 GENE.Phypoly_transcript_02068~~Phypoly_transcript_02068.p1  ORF type:complete len:962 (+),score=185.09 Phypoly_transcript_02068:171-2888(+)